jgi:ABC-type glycerol-3-phosphate transport system permease component
MGFAATVVYLVFDSASQDGNSFDFQLVFSMENFEYVFKYWDFFIYLKNSLILTFGTLAIQLITVTFGAYAVSRVDFAGKKVVMVILMAHLVIPSGVLIMGNYLTIKGLGCEYALWRNAIYFGHRWALCYCVNYKTIPADAEELQ